MRVLSGIQSTGTLHLGNYFGAVKTWLELQEQHETIIMIADLHTLTTLKNPQEVRTNTIQMFVDLIAVGIDRKRCILFVQSHVKEHTELAWILNTLTPVGELSRMTQFKEKAKAFSTANAGLFTYPVLQAADILLYQTDLVPVGKDQAQHLEFTRTLARKFNQRFGHTFKEPRAIIPKIGAKIMSLADPTKKMSKSLGSAHYVSLFEPLDSIRKKIQRAITDSGHEILFSPKKPGISNLLTIMSLTTNKSISTIEKEFSGKGYGEFKNAAADSIVEFVKPLQKRQQELMEDHTRMRKLIEEGAERARPIASATMKQVRVNVGLLEV